MINDDVVKKHYYAEFAERSRALFQPAGAQRRGAVRRPPPGLGGWRGGKPLARPWDVPQPPTAQLKQLASQRSFQAGAERRERMIMLTLVNHPDLLHEFLDDFAGLELTVPELEALRSVMIDRAALETGLDAGGLRDHLVDQGSGPLLQRLETQAKRLNEWFLGSGAAQDDARTGLRQMIALHRKTVTLERELRAAEATFAAEPTEENLAALKAVREQLSSQAGAEARIAGFGAASGREADAIT